MACNTNPCDVADNGSGTIDLPPAGCEYVSPEEVHEIINGLPPGTTIELDAIHRNFICGPVASCSVALPFGTCQGPGGNVDCFQSEAALTIAGTGALTGFSRTITVPLDIEVYTQAAEPAPALTGAWVWLCAALRTASSVWAIRRYAAET